MVIALVFAQIGLGCMKPNPLVAELADDGESDDGESDDGDSDENPDDLPPDLDDDPTDDSAEQESADEGPSCEQPAELTVACGGCLADACCLALELCASVEECMCLAACLLAGGSSNNCKSECGPKPSDVPELPPLLTCADEQCLEAC